MGIAAMILGILGAVIALTPCIGMAALIPAPIGLILGIVDVILKKKNRLPIGMGIAGIVLNMVAIAFAIFWIFILGTAAVATNVEEANRLNTLHQIR